MVRKKPNAYRTISEAAQQVGVPAHVLRFWESRFSQISPMKKGGGRRYYRPDDIALLSGIRALLYDDGLSIKQAQAELRGQGIGVITARGRDGVISDEPPKEAHGNDASQASPLDKDVQTAVPMAQDQVEELLDEHSQTQDRLNDTLQKLLAARSRLNETLQ